MIDHGCFPDDVASLDMYTGQQLVPQGEAGLTFIAGSELASYVESIGADNTGLMKLPATGDGPFKDQLASTSQTLAVTSWASDDQKAVAADFITFLHTPEQLAAYFEATGVPPSDDRFDPAAIEDPLVRQLFDWGTENPAPQFENFVPFDIWFNGFNTAQVQMITGQITTRGGRRRLHPGRGRQVAPGQPAAAGAVQAVGRAEGGGWRVGIARYAMTHSTASSPSCKSRSSTP